MVPYLSWSLRTSALSCPWSKGLPAASFSFAINSWLENFVLPTMPMLRMIERDAFVDHEA